MRDGRGRHKIRGLTGSQWQTLVFLRSYVATFGMPPSLQDIASHTGRWTSAIKETLRHLELKGYIERKPRISRGIVVLRKGKLAKEPTNDAV